ncbi:MAG TPA: serine hydrolase [Bacteroidota bacterium]|jgi:beta-lactamase class A
MSGTRYLRIILLFILAPLVLQAQNREGLEERIRGFAAEFGGRVGVSAVDLGSGERISVNADSLFPTASVIKLPVLVTLFYRLEKEPTLGDKPVLLADSVRKPGSGILQYVHGGQSLKLIDVATLMIILSDNTATNYVIDQFGREHDEKLEAVNSTMRELGLAHTKLLNKVYSFRTKKKTEEARRFGLGVSSPADMVKLLELIARGEIVDRKSCDSMVAILRNQQDILMAARLLPFQDDSTLWIGNKTGSLDEVKNDVGIVGCSKGRYAYAIFCSDSKDPGEQVDNRATLAVARISRLLYDHFLKR